MKDEDKKMFKAGNNSERTAGLVCAENEHEEKMAERYHVHRYEDADTIELIEDYIEEA